MNRKSSSFFSRVLLLFVAGAVLAVGVGGMEWQKRRSAVAPAQPIVAIVGSTASATINEAAGQVDILVSFDLRNLGQAAARDVRVRLVTGKSGKAEGMRVAEEFTLANTLHSGTRLVPVLRLQTPLRITAEGQRALGSQPVDILVRVSYADPAGAAFQEDFYMIYVTGQSGAEHASLAVRRTLEPRVAQLLDPPAPEAAAQ